MLKDIPVKAYSDRGLVPLNEALDEIPSRCFKKYLEQRKEEPLDLPPIRLRGQRRQVFGSLGSLGSILASKESLTSSIFTI